MKWPKIEIPFLKRRAPGRPQQLPNLNLLPPELVRPLIKPLGVLLLFLLVLEIGTILFLRSAINGRTNAVASYQNQMGNLNRAVQEGLKVSEQATKLKEQIASLEENPKLWLQLVSAFDISSLIQNISTNTPPDIKIHEFRGKGNSYILRGAGEPQAALAYFLKVRSLPIFSLVIIRFVDNPDAPAEGGFLLELTIK